MSDYIKNVKKDIKDSFGEENKYMFLVVSTRVALPLHEMTAVFWVTPNIIVLQRIALQFGLNRKMQSFVESIIGGVMTAAINISFSYMFY